MPKTKFQSVIFTLMMVFCMVFCMTVYTTALNAGGLAYSIFAEALRDMWIEYAVVFVLVFFFITPEALKLMRKYFDPEKNSPLLCTIATQSFTVLMVVPCITLFATFLHSGFTADWFVIWISTLAKCFPAAYILQVFFVGPFVRFVFRTIFAAQLSGKAAENRTSAAEPEMAH